ncbi:polysaccharide pyruvyl transferase CsaB [Peptoclostridium litorale DSM 5388]|uniref:Pyruvyl-transferase CsaB n=1 Tax=Peptoclostridium litorale DSM 5388 TaxID=1121324 RepID=A0A069RDI5_PEPLI|nr:polysaccharide pyruvyl transferase CsaB [Peptoclostridium litorale]KDR94828.1 pyruvyl-transferase CsaB [Peptoclostridium litorale DSM 5388]SIN93574.1 polysaccharide pyruvyl transferase CsaB [Peptoclostridium litorale DSM 5388]
MHRVLVSGYYGFNNVGDEAILKALIEGLRQTESECDIVVLSQHPRFTAQKHNVRSARRMNVFRLLWEIMRCDVLISGGGSLFQDVTSKRSILYYLSIIYIAKLMNKKVMVYSQGIGPVIKHSNRKFLKKVLGRVDLINVRDEKSQKELWDMGVQKDILVTADSVFGMKKPSGAKGALVLDKMGIPKGKKLVGMSVRPWNKGIDIKREFSSLCEAVANEMDCEIVLMPFHFYSDLAIMESIYESLDSSTKKRVHLLKEYLYVEDYLSLVSNMDVFVGMRLHGLIFSVLMGVPAVAVSYDPKIDSFMASIGKKTAASVFNFNFNDIIDEIKHIFSNIDSEREYIKEKTTMLSKQVKIHNEALNELLKSAAQGWKS